MQEVLVAQFKASIPRLSPNLHKGQLGRIGVFGGCFEYTGAPYFAATSAIRAGADLSFVFCCKSANIPIKSYSPELIVIPALMTRAEAKETFGLRFDQDLLPDQELEIKSSIIENISGWIQRLDTLVIGPGMGRDDLVIKCVLEIIKMARESKKTIVIDGDGLWAINDNFDLIKNYHRLVLTPNVAEYARLVKSILNWDVNTKGDPIDTRTFSQISEFIKQNKNYSVTVSEYVLTNLATNLGNVTVLRKGNPDMISDGRITVECRVAGGLKRCGGQGDVLAGITATLLAWNYSRVVSNYESVHTIKKRDDHPFLASKSILAAWGAAYITKECSKRAFELVGRSLTASEILQQVGPSFNDLCEHHDHYFS